MRGLIGSNVRWIRVRSESPLTLRLWRFLLVLAVLGSLALISLVRRRLLVIATLVLVLANRFAVVSSTSAAAQHSTSAPERGCCRWGPVILSIRHLDQHAYKQPKPGVMTDLGTMSLDNVVFPACTPPAASAEQE